MLHGNGCEPNHLMIEAARFLTEVLDLVNIIQLE